MNLLDVHLIVSHCFIQMREQCKTFNHFSAHFVIEDNRLYWCRVFHFGVTYGSVDETSQS